ncbi:MAG: cytochrome b/b6 domain-containing protein [Ignavibacteriae bacterium]|nr:cytochrome b/b6 domain-containing protein [Ignavibacteriota bacterium]
MKLKLIFFLLLAPYIIFSQTNSDCLDCHTDKELTYERNGKEVSLFVAENNIKLSAHGKLNCVQCHLGFDAYDIPHKSGNNIYKVDCANCHKDIADQNNTDIHHRLKAKNGISIPNCITCHSYHETKKIAQIENKGKYFCSDCHSETKTADGFHKRNFVSDETCADCHDNVNENRNILAKSVHEKLGCVDCHVYVANNLDDHADEPTLAVEQGCSFCHSDIVKTHQNSIHHIKTSEGNVDAAICSSCHGTHDILPAKDDSSRVNPKNLATTCGNCHDDPLFEEKYEMSVAFPGKMYSQSVHGKHVMAGDTNAANCSTCHGVHNIKNRVQEGSKISPLNLPNTCVECHEKEVIEYKNSVHWMRVQRGIKDAPVCNDCHNEHSVEEITDEGREANRLKMQQETCIGCHENSRVADKYGKKGGQVEQYLESYHGLAAVRGDKDAAMCVDCHNVHSILPSKNPMASTNVNNVTQTCQRCHTEATEIFSRSYSHETESESAKSIENIVSYIYFWLIIAVIGGMFVHNLIIFLFETRRKRRKEKNAIRMPRFTRNEVIQHILLAVSFIVLAITGFALKYPNSFWAEGLRTLGMSEPVRQWVHRASAVLMIILSLYHLFYLLFTARGRDVLMELLPTFKDITDVRDSLMYYLRINKEHPQFNQYDYAEKAEYWALIWGTFVMAVTGLILWFPTMVGDWAPIWLIKVSEIVHFMEAILATLAILVWHWFFVIFRPSEYPMSFTWTDGNMTLEHYRHHHERHFRRIILEWYEFNHEKHPRNKLTNYTSLFKKTLEKNDFNLERVIQGELNKDLELRMWYEEETEKINQKLSES